MDQYQVQELLNTMCRIEDYQHKALELLKRIETIHVRIEHAIEVSKRDEKADMFGYPRDTEATGKALDESGND